MTESSETSGSETPIAESDQPVAAPTRAPWPPPPAGSEVGVGAEHPELVVGGAFAGGLVLATILKRLAR